MRKNKQKGEAGITSGNATKINSKLGKAIVIAAGILVAVLLAFIIGLKLYYNSHWYPNTWIGNRDVSGMSCRESMELMNYVYDNYQLNISGRDGGSQTITQGEINYAVDIQNSVEEQFNAQHSSFPLFSLGKKKQIDLS